MTCIAGVVAKGRVYLRGDSAGAAGVQLVLRRDEKVFRTGPFVMGFTSSYRMGQVLRYAFTPPAPPTQDGGLMRYMATAFVDSLREALKTAGWARVESGQELGGVFLVGVHGRLFRVDGDFHVGEPRDAFDAVGSGADLARGALFATHAMAPNPRVRMALRAAERGNTDVRGPFRVVSG